MKGFIVTFLCSFLWSGSLQAVNNADNNQLLQYRGTAVPIAEELIWPAKSYQTIQTNFYGTAQRSITKPCPTKGHSQNVPPEQASNQLEQSPTRRSSIPSIKTFSNYNPAQSINSINIEENDQNSQLNNNDQDLYETKDSSEISASNENSDEENVFVEFAPSIANVGKEHSYDIHVTSDHLVKSDPASEYSKTKCSKKDSHISPKSSRRFLSKLNNSPNYQKAALNSDAQQATIITNNNGKVEKTLREDEKNGYLETNEIAIARSGKPQTDVFSNINYLNDPAKGPGVSLLQKSNLIATEYDRVCYACSSVSNPKCFKPDRRTTVKYCRKGTNGCLKKTYTFGNKTVLIRDCGRSCDEFPISSFPSYKSCSICQSDLCNSAYLVNANSLILTLPTLAIIALIKPLI